MQSSGGFPIVSLGSNFSSLDFGKTFISNFSKLNYNGGCCVTVSTYGCGPYREGSIPSFRPLKKSFK